MSTQEVIDTLLPKYKAEAEALLEKAANRLVRQITQGLVIEDAGDKLLITVEIPEEKK